MSRVLRLPIGVADPNPRAGDEQALRVMGDLDEPPGEDCAVRGVGDLDRPGGDDQAVRVLESTTSPWATRIDPLTWLAWSTAGARVAPRPVGGRRARRHVKTAIEVAPPSGGDGGGVGSGRYVTEPHGHADALVAGRPADLPQDGHDRAGERGSGLHVRRHSVAEAVRLTPSMSAASPTAARGGGGGNSSVRGEVAANAGRGLSPRESNASNSGAEAE